MDYTEKKLRRVNSYNGIIVNVHVDQVELVDGYKTMREVVEHPGGVAVIPVDTDGNVYCVRQYRYPYGTHLLEIPAGKMEKGEIPYECAIRELSEETGITAGQMVDLGKIYTSPGFSDETLYIYLALDLNVGERHLDRGEFLDDLTIPLDTLVDMVMNNEISDGKTVTAVLKAKKYLEGKA